jgi:hypothetical protein
MKTTASVRALIIAAVVAGGAAGCDRENSRGPAAQPSTGPAAPATGPTLGPAAVDQKDTNLHEDYAARNKGLDEAMSGKPPEQRRPVTIRPSTRPSSPDANSKTTVADYLIEAGDKKAMRQHVSLLEGRQKQGALNPGEEEELKKAREWLQKQE